MLEPASAARERANEVNCTEGGGMTTERPSKTKSS